MARRFYLSPILGTGTDVDPYRAAVHEHGVNHSAVIPTGADGQPLTNWCLVIVNAASQTALLADSRLDALPVNLDTTPGVAARNAIEATLTLRNIDVTLPADITWRQILRRIGQRLDERFDETRVDVGI